LQQTEQSLRVSEKTLGNFEQSTLGITTPSFFLCDRRILPRQVPMDADGGPNDGMRSDAQDEGYV